MVGFHAQFYVHKLICLAYTPLKLFGYVCFVDNNDPHRTKLDLMPLKMCFLDIHILERDASVIV